MVILSSNRIFINKRKDDNVNSVRETSIVCPLCKSDDAIITDPKSGEIIYSKCGMVILDKPLERKTDWQRHVTEGRKRTGLARHDVGLSTVIGKENMDSSRNKINPSMLSTLNRLRTWDFRTQLNNSSDRSLKAAFSELDSLKAIYRTAHSLKRRYPFR
jgi:transcription initiation factor TFIIB